MICLTQVINIWIARKPPGFGFVLMGSRRSAEDSIRGLNEKRIGGYRLLRMRISLLQKYQIVFQGDSGAVYYEGGGEERGRG